MPLATAQNSIRLTFPVLASLTDNTLTALTDITIPIKESVVTFHSAVARLTCDDIITGTGGTIGIRRIQLGLGGGTKTNSSNANVVSNSGENISLFHPVDFVARFTSDWNGAPMTCQCDVLIDQTTGTTLGMVNVCVTLDIAYEYDVSVYEITGVAATDVLTTKVSGTPTAHGLVVGALVRVKGIVGGAGATDDVYTVATVPTSSTLTLTGFSFTTDITAGALHLSPTRVKTARIPMAAPLGGLATSKPGTPSHMIPALDTEFPEADKVYRQTWIELYATTAQSGGVVDFTVSVEIDSAGAHTTSTYETALATDRQVRYCVPPSYLAGMDTSVTHNFYIWASVSRFHHPSVWLWCTYEYDEDSTTDIWVDGTSLHNTEMNLAGGGGGGAPTTISADIWIQEQGPITTKSIAFFWAIGSSSAISSMNARVGSGSYQAITDIGNIQACGSSGQIVNTAAYTLARGRNSLVFQAYHSGGDDSLGMTGQWFYAYTCEKPAGGSHLATKTMRLGASTTGTAAQAKNANAIDKPFARMTESPNWFLQNWGLEVYIFSLSTSATGLFAIGAMNSGDIGHRPIGQWLRNFDGEVGWTMLHLAPRSFVWPWADYWKGAPSANEDPCDPTAVGDVYVTFANGAINAGYGSYDFVYTYHSISYTVTGTVYGAVTGSVAITLHRSIDGEKLAETTRSGSGAWTMVWYDNTEDVYVTVVDNAGRSGRSRDGIAGTDTFDVILGVPKARAA